MSESYVYIVMGLIVLSLALGLWIGYGGGTRLVEMCAYEAISDDPKPWWRRALIDARARKEKEGIK